MYLCIQKDVPPSRRRPPDRQLSKEAHLNKYNIAVTTLVVRCTPALAAAHNQKEKENKYL